LRFIGGTQRAIEDSQKLPPPFGDLFYPTGIRTRDVSTNSKTKNLFKILRGAYGERRKDVQSFLWGLGSGRLSFVAHEPDAFI